MRGRRLGFLLLVAVTACAVVWLLHGGAPAPAPLPPPAPARSSAASPTSAPAAVPRPVAVAEEEGVERTEVAAAEAPTAPSARGDLLVRVRDTLGRGIPEASVRLVAGLPAALGEPGPWPDFEEERRAGEEGVARFTVPDPGVFSAEVSAPGYATALLGPLQAGDDVVAVLEEGGDVVGRVLEEGGVVAVAGARVVARAGSREWSAETGEDGRFKLRGLPPGTHRLFAECAGYEPGSVEVVVSPREETETALELPLGVLVRGLVVGPDDATPVAGARVSVYPPPRRGRRDDEPSPQPVAIRATDEEGRFELDGVSRRSFLDVRAEGMAPARVFLRDRRRRVVESDDGVLEVRVRLPAAGVVEGRVFDPSGAGVEGARVTVQGPFSEWLDAPEAASDDEGRFRIEGLPPGRRFGLLVVEPEGRFAPLAADGFVVPEDSARLEGVELALDPGATLTVTVLDSVGAPAPGAEVRLDGLDAELWTHLGSPPFQRADAQGKALWPGLPVGEVRASARRGDFVASPQAVALAAGGTFDLVLTLQEGARLEGVVVDERGVALDDVLVTAWGLEDRVVERLRRIVDRRLQSRDDAARGARRRRPPRPPGPPRPGDRGSPRPRGFEARGGDRARWFLQRWARGTLADPREPRAFLRFVRAFARSDADGRFVLRGLFPGESVTLSARLDGYWPAYEVAVPADGPPVRLELGALGGVRGIVLDARTRRPVSRFRVEAEPVEEQEPSSLGDLLTSKPRRSRRFSSEDGTFLLDGIAPGLYRLTARADGYRPSEPVALRVTSGITQEVSLSLEPAAVVQGRVLDRSGRAIAGLPVRMRRLPDAGAENAKGGRRTVERATRTSRSGRFTFFDPPPGRWRLFVGRERAPLASSAAFELEEGERTSRTLRIDAAGEIEVEVRAAEGGHVAGARVRLRGVQQGQVAVATTNALGRVRLERLAPDAYRVDVRAPGYTRDQATTEPLLPSGRLDVVVTLSKRP